MPSPTQDVSSGVQVDFGTDTTFAPLLRNYTLPELSVNDVETSHQETAAGTDFSWAKPRTYIPGDFIEGGEITGDFFFNPDTIPPLGKKQAITLTFPSGATWVFQGYLNKWGGDGHELDGAMMVTGSIKIAGPVEITSAS